MHIRCLHFLHPVEVEIVFNNLVYYSIVHTILYTANTPVSYYTLAWGLCMCLHATMLEYILHPTLMQEHH